MGRPPRRFESARACSFSLTRHEEKAGGRSPALRLGVRSSARSGSITSSKSFAPSPLSSCPCVCHRIPPKRLPLPLTHRRLPFDIEALEKIPRLPLEKRLAAAQEPRGPGRATGHRAATTGRGEQARCEEHVRTRRRHRERKWTPEGPLPRRSANSDNDSGDGTASGGRASSEGVPAGFKSRRG